MPKRDQIEKELTDISRQRDEAEALATEAGQNMCRLGTMTALDAVDADQARAAADDFAAAVERWKLLNDFHRRLRELLI